MTSPILDLPTPFDTLFSKGALTVNTKSVTPSLLRSDVIYGRTLHGLYSFLFNVIYNYYFLK